MPSATLENDCTFRTLNHRWPDLSVKVATQSLTMSVQNPVSRQFDESLIQLNAEFDEPDNCHHKHHKEAASFRKSHRPDITILVDWA